MSFPRAPLKRFNEHTGCAPPPGSYDLKSPNSLKGPVSFEKSQRFRKMKEGVVCSSALQQGESEKAPSSPTCIRKRASLGSTIRLLVMERGEQDKRIQALEEDFKKTEAKLLAAVKERTAFSSNVASLERQLVDLNKANELLKTKLSESCTKKKINSLCMELMETKNKMDAKDKTLIAKVEEMEAQLQKVQKNLECSLEDAKQLEEKLIAADQEKDTVVVEKAEMEKKLLECIAEIGEVSAQAEKYKLILGQSEDLLKQKDLDISTIKEELSKQVKELDVKCQSIQQEKENLINEGQVKEKCLNAEVELLKEKLNHDQQNLEILKQARETLLSLLKEEEVVSDSLRQELCHLQDKMLKERGLLEEEMEGALDELDRLQLEEEQTEKFIAQLEEENKLCGEELAQLQTKLNDYKVSITGEMESLKMKNSLLEEKVAVAEKAVEDAQQNLQELKMSKDKTEEEYARLLLDAETKLEGKEAEMKIFLESHLLKTTEFQSLIEDQNETIKKYLEEIENLRKESVNKERLIELREEVCTWRVLYEDLHNKVKPFQQQLDAFESEKNALLSEHGAAQEELNKLSDAYAKLLGHQNQKQKIKHVMKLKEENTWLKQEASRLRSQLAKEREAGKRLQEQLNAMQGIQRFDPSKAFQHESKENMVPKTPLKDGNRNK
ncbi:hyaluronan mediated motility receptor isoform X2 [Microcaecilia unicolor]|uniref:Hyaluronan mediated motility receptor isoform X2 n=1 Tax=Microcaecilia unicolor TaxID=1415580 RepID=A0A6P7Z0W2_9AMPH|nr:hyaluronan mediated motility receptor isoform X2 [Microcaecilia unicolor]